MYCPPHYCINIKGIFIIILKKSFKPLINGATPLFDDVSSISKIGFIGAAIAGLLVGFGTKLGNGCTSGHGVCGLPRLSKRSFVAVGSFMTLGIITATLKD